MTDDSAERVEQEVGLHGRPVDVRASLVEALELDLVGPGPGHELAEEKLRGNTRPSSWYLTGFLVPSGTAPETAADEGEEDGDLDEVPDLPGLSEESTEDRKAAKRVLLPSSIGLSFLANPGTLEVVVRWGDYKRSGEGRGPWQRTPRAQHLQIHLAGPVRSTQSVPESGGLQLVVSARKAPALPGIPEAALQASIFLVNRREPSSEVDARERTYAFQAQVEVNCPGSFFLARPDPRRSDSEWDDRVAAFHYRDVPRFATGHGVSAEWDELPGGGCRSVRTTWLPQAEVEKTETVEPEGVDLSMDRLGAIASPSEVRAALGPLPQAYRSWIHSQRRSLGGLAQVDRDTAEELLNRAGHAAKRIEHGIEVLERDADALDAFRLANRAVARALKHRLPEISREEGPRWRAFQLAFLLLNLPGIANPEDPNRKTVDLLFFPTGGGKTEAYLGLAAFTIVLRRLRRPEAGARAGAGVAVVMRYTLRLLTLDQLSRAAGLVCALELERETTPERYGEWPFEIGLWVGKGGTPNAMGRKGDKRRDTARKRTLDHQREPSRFPSPIPLEACPWCQTRFEPDSFSLTPNADNPTNLDVVCMNWECEFSGERALPLVAVDDPLYRRLPCFLIATVDKFATLPWEARSGVLLGGADRFYDEGFFGAASPEPGRLLPSPLPGPDLVIQDELHLISGPLGSMTGLYKTAIEALATRNPRDRPVPKPKIVASTATARLAREQIRGVFGRTLTQVFPPPGPSRSDSFFAEVRASGEANARLYLGIGSPGRNAKVLMRQALLPLMAAAQHAYREAGGRGNDENPADPYMTVLAYFNSLRELGGARRIVEEEVQHTLRRYGGRGRVSQKTRIFRDRRNLRDPVELTSRVGTSEVARVRDRLGQPMHGKSPVDIALATNMISVGLDIQRLGLMVVVGQPKTTAEYIQATSRVGRDDARPGLVVTLFNVHKPRDRSHYERFRHYHETFYRSVEAASVTPFAARALDRGLAGALVALARHARPALTQPLDVARISELRPTLEPLLTSAFMNRVASQQVTGEEGEELRHSVVDRVRDLLDSWVQAVDEYQQTGTKIRYQQYEGPHEGGYLLREMLDSEVHSAHQQKFRVNRSLRDVEPSVDLYVVEPEAG